MAQQEDFITASIDDYLISLADGINVAQRKLNKMVVPGQFGQPSVIYQLPRVDFELKMSFEIETNQLGQANTLTTNPTNEPSVKLMARPISPNNSTAQRSTTIEAASTIKGSFVATPAEGGKPPISIRSSLLQKGEREFIIAVTVTSAAGEKLAGIEVQYNMENDLIKKLNDNLKNPEKDWYEMQPGTRLAEGLVKTDQQGVARNTLFIDANETINANIAIIIDVFNERETLIYTTT
jgi:LysM repeat protein